MKSMLISKRLTCIPACLRIHILPLHAHTLCLLLPHHEKSSAGYMIQEEHHTALYPENVGALTCTARDEIGLK